MRRLICLVMGHDWHVDKALSGRTVSAFQFCVRCGKSGQEVQEEAPEESGLKARKSRTKKKIEDEDSDD